MVLQVLVDADNVAPSRLQPVLDVVTTLGPAALLTASGRPRALAGLRWPTGAALLSHEGWQRADLALAAAYRPGDGPLLLVSGDGDFALLAARHGGPVMVVSGAPSGRLRDVAAVIDPAVDGVEPLRQWLRAQGLTV